MVNKTIKKILRRRHFWRTVSFDELSELYTCQLLRTLSSSLIGIFVPIYLYKIGYSITAICVMFLVWSLVRPAVAYVSARIIARNGPKHSIALSVILQIIFLCILLSIQSLHWPLALLAVFGSFSVSLYMMAFDVDFSKIKHSEHGGKELSYLQIFERLGGVVGPLIGGLLATFFDPRYTIALAIIILCASLIPIFMSAEPTKRHQVISIKGFPWRRNKHDLRVSAAFMVENVVSNTVWPLFLGVFVLTKNTYAVLGLLTAAGTAIALVAIYLIGKLIDDRKGRLLLNVGAICNAILHLFRPFVTTIPQAFVINVFNEPLTAMYRMPYIKGQFDASDSVPGYRIIYFMLTQMHQALGTIALWTLLAIVSVTVDSKFALQVGFIVGAIASLLITRQRFAALR